MFSSQKGADEVGPVNRYIRDRMEPHETGTPLGGAKRETQKKRTREAGGPGKVGIWENAATGKKTVVGGG